MPPAFTILDSLRSNRSASNALCSKSITATPLSVISPRFYTASSHPQRRRRGSVQLLSRLFSLCNSSIPHCSAIASAIPSNVFALFFALSVVNIPLCCSPCLPLYEPDGHHVAIGATTFVGASGGRFFSHKHVRFVYGCPN